MADGGHWRKTQEEVNNPYGGGVNNRGGGKEGIDGGDDADGGGSDCWNFIFQ